MSDYDNAIFRLATAQEAEPEDYTGEDGLLYCGSCRQPKEAYVTGGKGFSDVTDTPKNVTASANAGKSRKPPTGNASTATPWRN